VNLDYKYWTFDNVVSDETRDSILTSLPDDIFKKGLIREKDGDPILEKKSRDNVVVFLGGQFARDIFIPYVNGANKSSGWNYDIDWFEDIQVSKYGVDKHYAWHHDAIGYPKGVGHKNYEGRERKLTAVTLLSDDFSGGEFELSHQISGDNNDTKIEVLPVDLSLGTILVFPSFLWHRVKPVTSGIRHSMQVWCLGPLFK
jgi:PKHD-type hydroxylase